MDVLSDILRRIRLRGVVYFQHHFSPPWGMKIDAEYTAHFHVLVAGEGWMQTAGMKESVHLATGDKLALLSGEEHWLAHNPEPPRTSGQALLTAYQNGSPLFQGDQPTTTLVCGHFEFDRNFDHPFIHDLPEVLHVRNSTERCKAWLDSVTELLIDESSSEQPGSQALLERLAEVLFVRLLRGYVEEQKPTSGFLVALEEPPIYEALTYIHNSPAADHSLEKIARYVGMSRSAFAAQFKELLGVPPMHYVTNWRMHRAKELLQESDAPMIEIASRVGYGSEAAFQRAFKRQFGQTPGTIRRSQNNGHITDN